MVTNCHSYREFLSQHTCAWACWQYFECVYLLSRCWTEDNEQLSLQELSDTLTSPRAAYCFQEILTVLQCLPASKLAHGGTRGIPHEKPCPPGQSCSASGGAGFAGGRSGCSHHFLPRRVVRWWRGCGWAQSDQLTFHYCLVLGQACQLFLWITRAGNIRFHKGIPPFWCNPISPKKQGARAKPTECITSSANPEKQPDILLGHPDTGVC